MIVVVCGVLKPLSEISFGKFMRERVRETHWTADTDLSDRPKCDVGLSLLYCSFRRNIEGRVRSANFPFFCFVHVDRTLRI